MVDRLEELGYLKYNNDECKSNPCVEGYFEKELSEEVIRDMRDWMQKRMRLDTRLCELMNEALGEFGIETETLWIDMRWDVGLPSTYDNRYIIVRKNPTLFKKLQTFLKKVEMFVVEPIIG